jgi:hypothetical protein
METNICLGCKFSSVKIDITVPEKYNLKSFAKKTKEFTSEIIPISGSKPIHYSLTFDSNRNESCGLDFKVNCSCIFDVKKSECLKFSQFQKKDNKINNLQREKKLSRGLGIEVIKTV